MADYQERVAERVIQAREAKGYDREPFALLAGISPKQLKRIEDGDSFPRLATVRKIAEAADVKVTDLRPDLEAEENELRLQLNRIERKLDRLLAATASPQKRATGAAQTAAQRSQQRKPGSRGSTGVRKKAAG